MKLLKMNIADLRPPEKNVRKHNENQIKEFARSLEKFGQIRPVVIDENNVVYCGNGLVEAAKSLGWEKIEVLRKGGMSEADKKKLMIADNRIYSLGYDDFDAINEMLEEIGDFDIPGFDTESLEAMFGDVDEDIKTDKQYIGFLDKETMDLVQNKSGYVLALRGKKTNRQKQKEFRTLYESISTSCSTAQEQTILTKLLFILCAIR